jgi:ElaB/YqjD/DUF883 family membrane-anchored ribosome-binding protein
MAHEYPPSTQDPTSADDRGAFSTLKTKVQDVGAKAAHRADQARVGAAAGLETVASTLHEKGDRVVATAAHSTADAVASGAEYLRDNDVRTMMSDLMEVIRRNPGRTLLGAAAVGFLLGRALSRD